MGRGANRIFNLVCIQTVGLISVLSLGIAAAEKIDLTKLPPAATAKVQFSVDIQPIFQKRCSSCHGAEKQEGGLRLDDRRRAFIGGDSGKVIIPSKSAESRLIHLVAALDPETGPMPPEGEGTPLTSEQVGLLRAWIDQGADWPQADSAGVAKTDLWALRPLLLPPLPTVQDKLWSQSPIDPFILAKLEREKVAPSPPADRITLLRRLSLDLLGLPPSPEEVSQYLADERPDAYERLVDRLLASPHFGERWGRHWLDLARYADSDGYEKDRPRPFAWRYRQWVLEAVNADMAYDQFTLEQLAGDLLPDTTLDQRVASGFHRNTLHNTEGGADPEEDRVKKTIDRTNTLGTAWLGLTVGCAQCHSHKYDPFTQREYYQLFAFFNNLDETDIDAPLPAERLRYEREKADFDQRHAPFVEALRKYEAEQLAAAQAKWEPTAASAVLVWTPLKSTAVKSKHGAKLDVLPDQSILAKGKNKVSDVYVVDCAAPETTLRAIRLEVLPDDSLPKNGPGRADHGNFVLTTFTVETVNGGTATKIKLHKAQADHSQNECDVSFAINDNPSDFWAVAPEFGKRHVAAFEFEQPLRIEPGTKLHITLDQTYGQPMTHNLGRFRLSVTDSTSPVTLEGLPPDVATAIAIEPAKRSDPQARQVTDYFKTVDPEWSRLNKALVDHAKQGPKPPETKAQAVVQRAETRATNMFVRGDFLNPGDPVEPCTPELLPPLKSRTAKPDRLDLAKWVVSDENPLPSRVAVNRLWERIFGRGIVATVDNFGKLAEPPTHPELLDWLAYRFRKDGWSVKQTIRSIVTSATYRQSSAVRTELLAIDPDNLWLARQQRRRVEAEIIRDIALTASGLLDPRIGGASVRPPQPQEYADLTYANSVKWTESKGGDRYRRGLYTFFQRTSPYPMLMTFDSPDSNECCVQRDSSNTPLQALTLWNDPAFFECAQAFGRRIVAEVPAMSDRGETNRRRALHAFTVCLGRVPTAVELDEVLRLQQAQQTLAERQPELAAKLCGAASPPAGTTAPELTAWIVVGRTLMNLDEFITRE